MKDLLIGLMKSLGAPFALAFLAKFWWNWPGNLVYLLFLDTYLLSFYIFEVRQQVLKKRVAFAQIVFWNQFIFLIFFFTIGIPRRSGITSESFWQMTGPVKYLIAGLAVLVGLGALLWKRKEQGKK